MRTISAVVFAFALFALPVIAADPKSSPVYREGVHYFALPEPVAVENPDKIEVTEVFWYGCSHCFHFEPFVLDWQKNLPCDVNFVQMPAMWNPLMETHARAYYTARRLGILEEVHQALYNALNIQRNPLEDAESVAALFARFGVNEQEAVNIFGSAETTASLKTADAKARAYQITGTPQLIVHGRYRIQAGQRVPKDQVFGVVDFLVEKIRQEKREST